MQVVGHVLKDCHFVLDYCRAGATSRARARAWWLPVSREKRTEEGSEEDAGPLRNVPQLLLPLLGRLPPPEPPDAGGAAAPSSGAAAAGPAGAVPDERREAEQARLMCIRWCGLRLNALCCFVPALLKHLWMFGTCPRQHVTKLSCRIALGQISNTMLYANCPASNLPSDESAILMHASTR